MVPNKTTFIEHLAAQQLFWSYDKNQLAQLPDELVIEHVLLYADVDDLKTLFQLFERAVIRQILEERLVPHQRYHQINCYLGTFFFGLDDVRTFLNNRLIAYPRLERFKLLASKDEF